jgi:ATP-dependent exoDNAse (exonuclease V) alpha subunit
MVLGLTSSGRQLDVVVGAAGSGKTSALAVAVSVWHRAGLVPFGAAISARAAAELAAGSGMPTTTIAQLLLDAERGALALGGHHVLVIDEAAMVDTRRLDRILKMVEDTDAKLVLVGDHHQLPAIAAGGGFRALMERTVPIVLHENHRQQEPWERGVLSRLREATTPNEDEAHVMAYRERGRLHIAGPDEDPRRTMVDDWDKARDDGVDVLMVARRRGDVAFLNAQARRRLQIRREMGRDALTTAHGRSFAIGDRVLCLKNDRRLKVYNSMFGTVTAIDPAVGSMTIAIGAEARTLPRRYLDAGHVDHGYATTVHKAQGVTVDRTFVLADQIMCRESGYTAMSRGRLRNDLYVADSLVDDRVVATPEEHPDLVRAFVRSEQEQLGLDTLGL